MAKRINPDVSQVAPDAAEESPIWDFRYRVSLTFWAAADAIREVTVSRACHAGRSGPGWRAGDIVDGEPIIDVHAVPVDEGRNVRMTVTAGVLVPGEGFAAGGDPVMTLVEAEGGELHAVEHARGFLHAELMAASVRVRFRGQGQDIHSA